MSNMEEFLISGKIELQDLKTSWFEAFVKAPLRYVIANLLGKYPEPNMDNCRKNNSLAWLHIRDRYLSCEKNPHIARVAKILFDLIICEREHDPPYEERIDFVGEQITMAYLCGNLLPRPHPITTQWEESVPRLSEWFELEERITNAEDEITNAMGDIAYLRGLIKERQQLLARYKGQKEEAK